MTDAVAAVAGVAGLNFSLRVAYLARLVGSTAGTWRGLLRAALVTRVSRDGVTVTVTAHGEFLVAHGCWARRVPWRDGPLWARDAADATVAKVAATVAHVRERTGSWDGSLTPLEGVRYCAVAEDETGRVLAWGDWPTPRGAATMCRRLAKAARQ